MEFLEGYILGLGMIVFIGPVFFLLLSVSFQLGTLSGIFVALGIIVSDVICVSLCYLGVTSFLYKSDTKFWIALIGGMLLILLGLQYLLNPGNSLAEKRDLPALHHLSCFAKGFLVNFVNPFVFFVWIGVVTYEKNLEASGYNALYYFSGVLLAILSTDLLKVFTARQIRSYLKPKILTNLYRVSGFVLIGFGIRMLLILV